MAYQLVYSSVPAGLVAGRSGFCTVARDREIREALVSSIEGFSNIYDRGAQAAEDKLGLPIIYSFRRIKVGTVDYHVLTRTRDAGSDYSGRGNHIAHSFILEPGELESLSITPAEAILALEDLKDKGWKDSWTEGDPRYFDAKEKISFSTLGKRVSLPAKHWRKSTGAAGNAALPWESGTSERTFLVFDSGESPRNVLQHIGESELLQDPDRRNPAALWSVSFTTHLQSSDDRAAFQWSVVKSGSPAHGSLGRSKGAVLEIQQGLKPPAGPLADIAEGAPAAGAAPSGGAASPGSGVAVASAGELTAPDALGGGKPDMPLPPGNRFNQKDFESEVDLIIGGGKKKKSGGGLLSVGKLSIAAGVLLLAGLAWHLLGPSAEEKRLAELKIQLNEHLNASEWEKARELVDGHKQRDDLKKPELVKPVAALKAAERFDRLPNDIHKWAEERKFFESAGKGLVAWKEFKAVSELRGIASDQLEGWLEFRKRIESAWGEVAAAGVSLKTRHVEFGLNDALADKYLELLKEFPQVEGADDTPFTTGKEAIGRIKRAGAIVRQYAGLAKDAGHLKPDGDSKSLTDRFEKLGLGNQALGLITEVEEAIKDSGLKQLFLEAPAEEPLKILSLTVSSFDSQVFRPKESEQPDAEKMTKVDKPGGDTNPKPSEEKAKPSLIDLPPTILVKWNENHQYKIQLGQNFPPCGFSETVLPAAHPALRPGNEAMWRPIVTNKIREVMAKPPIFDRELDGTLLSLKGQFNAENRGRFADGFLIRFAQKGEGKPEYQVAFTNSASPAGFLIELPAVEGLEREFGEDGSVTIQLSAEAQRTLEKLQPGDAAVNSAPLYLRVMFKGEANPASSEAAVSEEGIPFSAVNYPLLAAGGGIEKQKEDINSELKKWTEISDLGGIFEDSFVKVAAKNLYQKVAELEKQTIDKGKGKVELKVKRKAVASLQVLDIQKQNCPAFVDLINGIANEVVERELYFELGEGSGSDREVLETFVSRRAGWTKGEFAGVREALDMVTAHAEKRLKKVEGNADVLPGKEATVTFDNHLRRLQEREQKANADRFFGNWARMFSKEKLDQIWPWFEKSGNADLDKEISGKLNELNEQLKRLKNQQKNAKLLREARLTDLGEWFLHLEVTIPETASAPARKELIRLVRFTEGPESPNPDSGGAPTIDSPAAALGDSETGGGN